MTDDDYVDFMIWHRGLAVPAARNLDDPDVQRAFALPRNRLCQLSPPIMENRQGQFYRSKRILQ